MSKLMTTQKVVQDILQNDPKTRNSDDLLYLRTAERIAGRGVANLSFSSVMIYRSMHGIPTYETVRRTRQKLQEKYPELRASKVVQQVREEYEEKYRAYARGEEE